MKDRDKRIMSAAKRAQIYTKVDTEGALIKTKAKLSLDKDQKTRTINWFHTLKIAASIVVAIGIGWVVYLNQFATEWTTIATGDHIQEYKLADGTLVTLNKNSKLRIDRNMTKRRHGILKGEAFFDVKRDESRPFTISTGDAIVRVLGTSFNILSDEEQVDVSVASGKVRVSDEEHKENFVTLSKGDAVHFVLATKALKINPVDDNYMAWKTGIFTFKDTPVRVAIEALAEKHGKDLLFSKSVNNCRITSTFDNPSWDKITREFSLIHSLEFNALPNGQIKVEGGSCE